MSFPSDLEIARKAELKPLTDIAKESGIPEKSLELYGEGAAKIKLEAIDAMAVSYTHLTLPTICSV